MIKQTAGRDSLGSFAPSFAHYNDDVLVYYKKKIVIIIVISVFF